MSRPRGVPAAPALLAVLGTLLCAVLAQLAVAGPAAATPGPANAPEYWFDSWQIPQLWARGDRGQGITIAEIDTGVNAALPALAGRILPGTDFGDGGDGQVDRDLNPFGHGTAMASIMVARTGLLGITGIAPDARILPVAVPLAGTSDASKPDHLADAIRYAAGHGARIISMSLGGLSSPQTQASPCPDDEQQAIYYALGKGAIVVASVGNTGPTRNLIEEPAACLGVVSVGATTTTGAVADFSAREPYLTLVAPGVGVPSLGRVAGDAYSGDGTSQAAAITSASLAVAWSADPTQTGQRLVARMLATLDEPQAVPSPAYGYGLLDLYRMVTETVPATAADPVYAQAAPFRQRNDALSAVSPSLPPPAATAPIPVGGPPAVVGLRPPQDGVIRGAVLAAAGLVGLVLLALAGARRRRASSGAGPAGPEHSGAGLSDPAGATPG